MKRVLKWVRHGGTSLLRRKRYELLEAYANGLKYSVSGDEPFEKWHATVQLDPDGRFGAFESRELAQQACQAHADKFSEELDPENLAHLSIAQINAELAFLEEAWLPHNTAGTCDGADSMADVLSIEEWCWVAGVGESLVLNSPDSERERVRDRLRLIYSESKYALSMGERLWFAERGDVEAAVMKFEMRWDSSKNLQDEEFEKLYEDHRILMHRVSPADADWVLDRLRPLVSRRW